MSNILDPEPETKKRKKEENVQTMTEIADESLSWLAMASIISIYKTKPEGKLSSKAEKIFEKMNEEVEERNCYSYPVDLDAQLPDKEGCRGLFSQLHEIVTNIVEPFRTDSLPTFNPFSLTYTGGSFDDPATITSEKLIEAAKTGDKRYDDTVKRKFLLDRGNELTDAELKFFYDRGHPKNDQTKGYLPVPEFRYEKDGLDLLRQKIYTTSMCIVKGFTENGFDNDFFTLDALTESLNRKQRTEVIRQVPQKTSTNFPMKAAPSEMLFPNTWETIQHKHQYFLHEFIDSDNKIVELSFEAYQRIAKFPEKMEDVVEKHKENLREHSLRIPATINKQKHHDVTLTTFASNFDMMDSVFDKQRAMINAVFPDFLRPTGNLLGYSGESLRGLNEVQAYIKCPGCRTCAHLENNGLGSVNYNIGPGDCIWFGVPFEYAGGFQKLLESKLEGNSKNELHNIDYWPQEKEIIAAGIPLIKFVQKPGDLVYVGIGSYHWVQSNDFTTNLAWNVGQPTYMQLATAVISHDNYLANNRHSVTPLETIAWNIAKESIKDGHDKLGIDDNMKALVKRILARSLSKYQIELDYTLKQGLPLEFSKTLKPVERCHYCDEVLLNFIPMYQIPKEKGIKGKQPVCFSCIKRHIDEYDAKKRQEVLRKGTLKPKPRRKSQFTLKRKIEKDPRLQYQVKQRFHMDELCRIFDEFQSY